MKIGDIDLRYLAATFTFIVVASILGRVRNGGN